MAGADSGADIVILGARVLTMDEAAPRAEAVAIAGNRILAVGPDAEIAPMLRPGGRRIEAGGATLLPGFVEAHMHLFAGAYGRRLLQLAGVEAAETMGEAIRAFAAANPDEGLLIGQGAGYDLFEQAVEAPRALLDRCEPARPLIVMAYDFHTGWANTAALRAAGLLGGRDVGEGNEVVMGPDGTATGELREKNAFLPVYALRTSGGREMLGLSGLEPETPPTAEERRADFEALKEGLRFCASHGITQIHNMDGNRYQLDLLREIEAEGDLICRVEVPYHLTNVKPLSDLEEASRLHEEFRSAKLKSGRVKIFCDGVLESGTAVLLEDYCDRPGWRGEPLFDADTFRAAAVEIDRRGLQISVHAIGDGAVRLVLDGYEAARAANGARDSRHRIEHIEMIDPADIPRFAELGVVASPQPPHPPGVLGQPEGNISGAIGPVRARTAYAWRMLKDVGAPIAFSSDWPVSRIEPLLGIRAAMTRKPWTPDLPDQRLTLTETLHAYTAGGAYAGFREVETGAIRAGMLADLVLLSGDIEAAEPDAISELGPRLTICDGAVTFEAA